MNITIFMPFLIAHIIYIDIIYLLTKINTSSQMAGCVYLLFYGDLYHLTLLIFESTD